MNIREKAYWIFDAAKGNKISTHLEEIKKVQANPFSAAAAEIKEKNVLNLLEHSTSTVPFYKSYSTRKLKDFPVIKKTIVQENFDDFKSEAFDFQSLFKVYTSGSTGVPFQLYHDKNKRNRNTADVLYFLEKTGYSIGNKLYELEVWRDHNLKSPLKNFVQNSVQFDISKLTDIRISQFIEKLSKDSARKNILGFASALESICQYLDTHGKNQDIFNLESIIANSEYLNEYTRKSLKKYFNTAVYSRYSNEELGLLAHQTDTSKDLFELNWASYHIELLDLDEDIPVKQGMPGRLVITDLFNFSMPLIRYDTGDIASFDTGTTNNRYLNVVEGRKMDLIFDTKGNPLSSYLVYTKFYPFYELLNQYQFIQEDNKKYRVKLNVKNNFAEQEVLLIDAIKKDFGEDADVIIDYVDEIPPLSSGKRKKVINLMT